ncbi:MAG TPA: translation initiation factor IF-2 [Cyanobacteria bacterium UBA8803]|nr:translation initiation factor IF-2 [Cyanobacteria bacterium UBA9273]HBL60412.1 translation initiation factor IF-2 [Cyanobacteria bacterium UBA8803]
MNDDRVRIYDLSKELSVENKELLTICSQLNIAVKSHSSTISKTDAERLRAAAGKQAALAGSSRRKSTAKVPLPHSQVSNNTQPEPSVSHQQQILAIHKSKTQEQNGLKEAQITARAPQPPVASLQVPRPYSPPVSPLPPTPPTQPAISTSQSETTAVKADADRTASTSQVLATPPKPAEVLEKPQLAQPPTRPIPPVAAPPKPPEPERPAKKRDRPSGLDATPSDSPNRVATLTEKPPRRQSPNGRDPVNQTDKQSVPTTEKKKASKSAQASVAASLEPATPEVPPIVELQRPKPPRLNEPVTPAVTISPEPVAVREQPEVIEQEPAEIPPQPQTISEPPQLTKPPIRPVPPVAQKPAQEKQPARKRDRVNKTSDKQVKTTTETPASQPTRPTLVALKAKPEISKTKPVVELQRPKPPRLSEPTTATVAPLRKPTLVKAEPQVAAEEPDSLDVLVSPVELLDRPIRPRPIKGSGKLQEEELDNEQESKAKSGKGGNKVKRLKPILDIDEEEYLEDTELDLDTPLFASLAVARPAKQKAPAAKTPVSASSTVTKSTKSRNSRPSHRHAELERTQQRPETLVVTGSMTVQQLAQALAVQDTEIIKILFLKGMAVNITQSLDISTLTLVAEELGVGLETAQPKAPALKLTEILDVEDLENLQPRPPVVTIMGHVDHGKTSLLDAIRHTKVAKGEAGGITQHIGAYHVDVEQDGQVQQVVFLDTPGHEAFTAMRARGARVTDIAILVVAADDGVRPQTVEAISHAKAAEVPIIVAINKIDKAEAQPERVMQELTEYGLVAEQWGGETIVVPVSAIQKENLDTLLEMILLVAEVSDLQANPDRAALGTVIEANLDKTKGPVATLLVQNGTLRVGDTLVAGSVLGKVRAMVDDRGRKVKAATPSLAVEVLGLSDVPEAGDEFKVFSNEKEARAIATAKAEQQRQSRLLQGRITLTTLSAQAQEGKLKELNLILKADVQGSVEAIVGALTQLPQNEVQIRLLLAAAGEITETDIDLAAASNAVIVGFSTTITTGARVAAEQAGVDVREYDIIYKLLEDIQGAMEGLLEPELVEETLGQVEVRAVFSVGRGKVAGCHVISGKAIRNCKVRVRRGGKVIYEGILDSLKRMKEDVREVNAGYECGIGIDKFNDWVEGDQIETYQMVTKRRTLSAVK